MNSDEYKNLVKRLVAKGREIAGSNLALSRATGLTPSRLNFWFNGENLPQANALESLKRYVQRHEDGAEPKPLPEPVEVALPTMPVLGAVAAGSVDWNENSGRIKDAVAWAGLWRSSRYWGLTDSLKDKDGNVLQEVVLLEVRGDSMEPRYYDGEIIACRVPKNVDDLPEGTPVVIRDEDGQTFKLLRRATDGTVVGEPINKAHRTIIFRRTRDLRVPLVVIGKLDPGTRTHDLRNIINNTKGLRKGPGK